MAENLVINGVTYPGVNILSMTNTAGATVPYAKVLTIPDYWQDHLAGKIADIRARQDAGGKDSFSFVVIADMHYPSNLGNHAPLLAEYICQKCDIHYVLLLGDVRTRGLRNTKEDVLAEFDALEIILEPIRHRTLQTQGNHDAGYGSGDYDGDGDADTYAFELSHAEIYNRIYRKTGMVGACHFDSSGTGYWVDDVSNRVRYIVLNTQNTSEEKNPDGTSKYPSMWLFRFGQSQFDLTIEALNSVPGDDWGVVLAGHCPITTTEIGDRDLMQGMLAAYKKKEAYTGEYAGTAAGGAAYTNLAEPLPDNTTDTTKWVNGYRYGSSGGPSAQAGTTLSNLIPCKKGDVIRIKGVTLRENTDRIAVFYPGSENGTRGYFNNGITASNTPVSYDGLSDGVYKFTISSTSTEEIYGFRFAMPTPDDASAVIVTVNEEIIESSGPGYDYVSVDADFSKAKGNLVGYFAGHTHADTDSSSAGFPVVTTRCDAKQENTDALKAERVAGTTTEQSFDVFTVNRKTGKIYATKIGAGADREIGY